MGFSFLVSTFGKFSEFDQKEGYKPSKHFLGVCDLPLAFLTPSVFSSQEWEGLSDGAMSDVLLCLDTTAACQCGLIRTTALPPVCSSPDMPSDPCQERNHIPAENSRGWHLREPIVPAGGG